MSRGSEGASFSSAGVRLSSLGGDRKGLLMEKKPNRNETKTPKTQPLQKMIGNSKLQISEDDASRLIGSIVEKGMSDGPNTKPFPTPAPNPTVLPFPVARHRSHGPVSSPALLCPQTLPVDSELQSLLYPPFCPLWC